MDGSRHYTGVQESMDKEGQTQPVIMSEGKFDDGITVSRSRTGLAETA
jgi:hypothetical protein